MSNILCNYCLRPFTVNARTKEKTSEKGKNYGTLNKPAMYSLAFNFLEFPKKYSKDPHMCFLKPWCILNSYPGVF